MIPACAHSVLGDLETLARVTHQRTLGQFYVFKSNLGVAMWGVVVTRDR
jgi:hypothetical protein